MSRAEYARQWRQRRKAATGLRLVHGRWTDEPRKKRSPGEEPPHGTTARHNWRTDPCRCDECRAAWNAYNLARYYARKAEQQQRVSQEGVTASDSAGPGSPSGEWSDERHHVAPEGARRPQCSKAVHFFGANSIICNCGAHRWGHE